MNDTLTVDTLRAMARAQGLDLAEDELRGLLPLVEASRVLLAQLDGALTPEVEPASQYRIL